MKLILHLIAALLSVEGFAQPAYVDYAAGMHLVSSRFDPAALNARCTFAVPSGSLVPTWSSVVVTPPSWAVKHVPSWQGIALSSPNALTVAFTNNPAPQLPLALPAGISLVASQTNGPATFQDIVGRLPDPGTRLLRLLTNYAGNPYIDFSETNYAIYTYRDGAWSPTEPVMDAGEAVWISQPPVFSNLQVSGSQLSFDVLTPSMGTLAVEFSDGLVEGFAWQPLTNFTGNTGATRNVVDPTILSDNPKRCYRLRAY